MSMTARQKIVCTFSALTMILMLHACSDGSETSDKVAQQVQQAPQVEQSRNKPSASPAPGGGAGAEAPQERPLKIGVIGPESGTDSEYGKQVLAGILAAAKRFNAEGGIGGSPIEVINIDNKGDPELTNRGVAYLIRQGVIGILSAPTGWSTFAPVHRVNSSKTIFISIGSRRRIERSGPYIFRTALPDEMATDELIAYASEALGYENYALVGSSDYSYSLDISSLFKRAVLKHGGTISVETDTYDTYLGSRNLLPAIDAIKNDVDKLQAVIFTGGAEEAALFAKGLRDAGVNLPIIGSEDLSDEGYLKECRNRKGSLFYASYSLLDHSPEMDRFRKDVGMKNPDRFSALAYDSFMLLAEAIKAAGSTDSARVRDALIRSEGYVGVTGRTSFTEGGMPVKHPFIYGVKSGDGSKGFVLLKHQ